MKIYKYMSLRNAMSALLSHRLRVSDPIMFNDPFDCVGTSDGAFGGKAKIDFGNSEALRQVLSSRVAFSNKLRVLCFADAETRDPKTEMLLWSHYADNGAGVRIAFEFEDPREFSSTPTKVRRVQYKDSIPELDMIAYEENPRIVFNDFLEECVWTKGTSWAYENEVRFVVMCENLTAVPNSRDFQYIAFKPACVREIVFGPCVLLSDVKKQLKKLDAEYGDVAAYGWARCNVKEYRYDYIMVRQSVR